MGITQDTFLVRIAEGHQTRSALGETSGPSVGQACSSYLLKATPL